MKNKLITYATGAYKLHQKKLHDFAKIHSLFDEQESFDDLWLKKTLFYEKNKWTFDNIQRGAGSYLWKAYLVLTELQKAKDGDAITYMDSTDLIKLEYLSDFKKIMLNELFTKQYCLVQTPWQTAAYTKYDCFYFMNCLESKYFLSKQIETGLVAFVKNDKTLKIAKEWFAYSLNPFIISDYKSMMGDDDTSFVDHRHDQSILTLLAIKHNMKPSNLLFNFIDYNTGDIPASHYDIHRTKITKYFE